MSNVDKFVFSQSIIWTESRMDSKDDRSKFKDKPNKGQEQWKIDVYQYMDDKWTEEVDKL